MSDLTTTNATSDLPMQFTTDDRDHVNAMALPTDDNSLSALWRTKISESRAHIDQTSQEAVPYDELGDTRDTVQINLYDTLEGLDTLSLAHTQTQNINIDDHNDVLATYQQAYQDYKKICGNDETPALIERWNHLNMGDQISCVSLSERFAEVDRKVATSFVPGHPLASGMPAGSQFNFNSPASRWAFKLSLYYGRNHLTEYPETFDYQTDYDTTGGTLELSRDFSAPNLAGAFKTRRLTFGLPLHFVRGGYGNRGSRVTSALATVGWQQGIATFTTRKLAASFYVHPEIGVGAASNELNFGKGTPLENGFSLVTRAQLSGGLEFCTSNQQCLSLFGGVYTEHSQGEPDPYNNRAWFIGGSVRTPFPSTRRQQGNAP